jgi:hypothetical protein
VLAHHVTAAVDEQDVAAGDALVAAGAEGIEGVFPGAGLAGSGAGISGVGAAGSLAGVATINADVVGRGGLGGLGDRRYGEIGSGPPIRSTPSITRGRDLSGASHDAGG